MTLFEAKPLTEVEPGTYVGVVREVSRDTIVPKQGRNAGKDVEVTRWVWFLEGAGEDVESITGIDPTSDRSNLHAYLTALIGPAGRDGWLELTPEKLVGRRANVTVAIDNGFLKVTAVTPMPKSGTATPPPVPPQAAIEQTVSPLREDGEPEQDNLPF